MIHIARKTERNKPNSLKKTSCSDKLKQVVDLSNPNHKNHISPYYYGAEDVRKKLKTMYHDKCAYCENKDEEDIEVEHYRPKNEVKGEVHEGYYWLCFEWTNLLPSCHVCNKANFKGTNFPIDSNRVFHPLYKLNQELDFDSSKLNSDYLKNEKPLLLNPEQEGFNPFNYFDISKKGLIVEKPQNNTYEFRQTNKTIEILGFNKRTKLMSYRKKSIRHLFYKVLKPALKKLFLSRNENDFKEIVFRELRILKENANPTKEYSFFWSYLYMNFPQYVDFYIKGKHRNPFLRLYNEFKQQNP